MKANFEASGFSTLLLIVFITLKLCNIIDWSWWWVASPLWMPIVGVALIGILALVTPTIIDVIK